MAENKGETTLTDVRLSVGLLERDVIMNAKVIDKLSEAVEKIEEMNANLVKIIAVHELKHENTTDDIRELNQRIIDATRLTTTTTTTISATEADAKSTLDELKKWKYMIIGGTFVLGWLLAHIKWSVLATIFGLQ